MGIPSYFSYIVKMYPTIIQKYVKNNMKVHNLYLDCNSIIYDVYNKLDTNSSDNNIITNTIISRVISKIEDYISVISPSQTVMIAFDGVAPVAKLEQQRSRRYKSWYQNKISKSIFNKSTPDPWNTAAITPGTSFMSQLNSAISSHFDTTSFSKYNVSNIIVSGSDNVGEGEHKVFEYIRNEPEKHSNEHTIIYGLDADLIMLSINHLSICPNIYLFRETPQFIQSIDSSLEPNENYYLNIPELTNSIIKYMTNDAEDINYNKINKVYDYIFMGFFLGNDFMPHFPAINIRTGGVDKLLNAYKAVIGESDHCLTDGKNIYWGNVRKLVNHLAALEEEYIIKEHKSRNNKEKHFMHNNTPEEKYKIFEATPMRNRSIEKYINPFKPHWQSRYYRSLFGITLDTNGEQKRDICINYLEGLEWTMKYYTTGCPDWRWRYKYNYPPLLTDLIHYIPLFDTTFVENKDKNPVSDIVQLCYVLPRESLNLLPMRFNLELLKNKSDWYDSNCEFTWAYCRYFWESHVDMNEIDIAELETFVRKNRHLLM